jgi:hypothetical protein
MHADEPLQLSDGSGRARQLGILGTGDLAALARRTQAKDR